MKTHEQFLKEVYSLVGNEYEVVGQYINSRINILIRHNLCNNSYEVTPDNFLRGNRCKYCQHRSYKKTTEEFKQEVFNLVSNEYKVLSEYVTNIIPIKMKHNLCGTIYDVTPNNFLSKNRRCPECAGNKKRTKEKFKQELFDLCGNEYEIIGKFTNTLTNVLLRHNTCGNEWFVKPNNLINQNNRCPHCCNGISKGEIKLKEAFENNNLEYIFQYKFKDCKNIRPLPFDFYIPKYNTCIEFDGIQHYEPREIFGGLDYYNYVRVNDEIKSKYCIKNNIQLLRISYLEINNIDSIINEYSKDIKKTSEAGATMFVVRKYYGRKYVNEVKFK